MFICLHWNAIRVILRYMRNEVLYTVEHCWYWVLVFGITEIVLDQRTRRCFARTYFCLMNSDVSEKIELAAHQELANANAEIHGEDKPFHDALNLWKSHGTNIVVVVIASVGKFIRVAPPTQTFT